MSKKSKVLSILLMFSLVIFSVLFYGNGAEKAAAQSSESDGVNKEKYGNVLDIGPDVREKGKGENFSEKLKKYHDEAAKNDNNNPSKFVDQTASNDKYFSFDGGTKSFLSNDRLDGNYYHDFTLRSIGENVEVWVANDLSYPVGDPRKPHVITQEQVDKLATEFDNNIYKQTALFGELDSRTGENAARPDVPDDYYVSEDGKDRVMILVENMRDLNYHNPDALYILGVYRPVTEASTDRNTVFLDSRNWENRLDPNQNYGVYQTLAHEYTHLINWDYDANDETWFFEGFGYLAPFLTGYGHPTQLDYFLSNTENSLIEWSEPGLGQSNYGQSYLLALYLYEQFGTDFMQTIFQDQKNGIESINSALDEIGADVDFQEVYRNFLIAMQVDNEKPGGGKYNFENIDIDLPYPEKWQTVDDPLNPDNSVLWGNEGHNSRNTLMMETDLTEAENATLQFDHYLQIEQGYDFGVVQVSTDNGKTWTSLANDNTTSEASTGNEAIVNNLPGFTGTADNWATEKFDLSQYAGQEILVQFRYLTDLGVNEAGWYVDNIEIPEIGISHDGSSLEGFSTEAERTNNKPGLPSWGADFIKLGDTDDFKTISFEGDDFQQLNWQTVSDPVNDGNNVLWGNDGHNLSNQMVIETDLTDVENATLQFDNYYRIEPAYDFAAVQVSTDQGETWTSLENENTSYDAAPEGSETVLNNLPGFTGNSDGWVDETFDLSQYAGQKVWLQFRYMTDIGINRAGWYIDNIEIPEIGFSNDGNSTEGFATIDEMKSEGRVEFGVTLVNEKEVANGKRTQHKVLNYDPASLSERDFVRLKQIASKGDNYMIVWYAPKNEKRGAVDYSYDLKKSHNQNKK